MITKTPRSLSALMITGMLIALPLSGIAATDNEVNPPTLHIPLASDGYGQALTTTDKASVTEEPVPEPSTSLLSALGVLIIFRRRRC